ncbi:MAG TPA: hypothetical protein VK790_07220 [Solirubrobacteraceae bacterium]|jgi:hypothetical protein|nr:hypothetical protein [Solirubrobacteraceae bacterium]
MGDKAADTDLVERAAYSWLSARLSDKAPSEWVHDLQTEWMTTGQFECLWMFILRLCEIVDPKNKSVIALIGTDPLFELFLEFPDQAIEAMESMGDQQPALIEALSIVDAEADETQSRINAIVARYG